VRRSSLVAPFDSDRNSAVTPASPMACRSDATSRSRGQRTWPPAAFISSRYFWKRSTAASTVGAATGFCRFTGAGAARSS
jgi:hypothetical protein